MEPEKRNPEAPHTAAPAPYAAGTGSAPVLNGTAGFAQMGYRELLHLKHSDPEEYARRKAQAETRQGG